MFKQQISGILNLSLPLIILYNIWPISIENIIGQIVCSLLLGAYVYYLGWVQMHKLQQNLQYSPTGQYRDYFVHLLEECKVDPQVIILKYAYTSESTAMAVGNTVIIDPIACHDLNNDPQAVAVQEIIKIHIIPHLSQSVKIRLEAIADIFTPAAQRFLFKHEVGHVMHHFSAKKLFVILTTTAIATFCAIQAALFAMQFHGAIAILVGMTVGWMMDIILTLLSNLVWKLGQEKQADAFAVEHSSDDDIVAAAEFFIQHQVIVDRYSELDIIMSHLPSVVRSGHQNGKVRAAYILQLMADKK